MLLIGQNCLNIKSLTYYLKNKENSLSFFQKYGHKLEELSILSESLFRE